jgi:hypothetical protein
MGGMRTLCVRHDIYAQDGHTVSAYRAPTRRQQKAYHFLLSDPTVGRRKPNIFYCLTLP